MSSFGLTAANSAAPTRRVPREEDPQYQPPLLCLEVISSDRMPWIKPPPVEAMAGNGKWEKWVQYENSMTNPPTLYIRKCGHNWKQQSSHSVWYDRRHRCELYLRADFQVPLGVVQVEVFGSPAPPNLYYESEHHDGVLKPVLRCPSRWMYRTRDSPRDIGLVLPCPAANSLPMKGTTTPTVQCSAPYDSDEDDDSGGESSDNESPPPAPPAPGDPVVMVVDVALQEIEVDRSESSPSAAPQGRAVGDEAEVVKPVVDVHPAPMEEMEVDGPESSLSAAPRPDKGKGRTVGDEENKGCDEDCVSLGEPSDDKLACPDKEEGRTGVEEE
ncbi:hypothetical protein C8R44DRAFT_891433 [Mycena epipterygia]|nr:hypothetical protein C8R44DRAFT_891433 [Mycena epipterygia]